MSHLVIPLRLKMHSLWIHILPVLQTSECSTCSPGLATSTIFSHWPPHAHVIGGSYPHLFWSHHPIANIEAVSTFFQAIASTLTTLNILFTFTGDEPSRLLESFPCHGNKAVFPKPTTLSLLQANHPALPSLKLLQFLDQHAYTLKHLSLQHT